MAQKEDIGKLIKRQFEGVEKSPADSLWEKIDGTLQKRRKKKTAFLLLLLLAFIIAVNSFWFLDNFSHQNNSDQNPITNEITNEKSTLKTGIENNNSIKIVNSNISEDTIDENLKLTDKVTTEHIKSEKNLIHTNKPTQTKKHVSGSEKTNFKSNQDQAVTHIQQDNIQKTTTTTDPANNSISELDIVEVSPEQKQDSIPAENLDIAEVSPEQKSDSIPAEKNENNPKKVETNKLTNKWAVTILGGINTYNSFNKSSLIHPSLNDFNRSGTLDYTYGFAIRFDLTDNLAISYGINKTTFSYFTQNIPASNEADINRILNYTDFSSGQTISSSELATFLQSDSQTDLLHQTEYLELPLLIRYSLSNKRFGVQTLGGISTYLHNKENLYVQRENDDRLKVGSLNNLAGASFSLNLGIGLYYEISENLLIELNPTFKYNLSQFSSKASGDNPYFIGVFTGLTYKLF